MQFALTVNFIHSKLHLLQVRRQYSMDLVQVVIQWNFNSVQHGIQCVLHPVHLWLTATIGPSWVQWERAFNATRIKCNLKSIQPGIQCNLRSVQPYRDSMIPGFGAGYNNGRCNYWFNSPWIQCIYGSNVIRIQCNIQCNMDSDVPGFTICSV